MGIDTSRVGAYIVELRKRKNITQSQLGERLNISYQAVSKWERGEALPDTTILVDLASILETSVDDLLHGGGKILNFTRKIYVKDIKKGVNYLSSIGNLIGKDNTIYEGIVEGINNKMNMNVEECFGDSYKREALIAEVIVQNIMSGAYVDITDIKNNLEHEHWIKIICDYANKFGIK